MSGGNDRRPRISRLQMNFMGMSPETGTMLPHRRRPGFACTGLSMANGRRSLRKRARNRYPAPGTSRIVLKRFSKAGSGDGARELGCRDCRQFRHRQLSTLCRPMAASVRQDGGDIGQAM